MTSNRLAFVTLTGLMLTACVEGSSPDPGRDGAPTAAAGKADQISGADDPSGLLGVAERRLSLLISADEIGQSFGVDEDNIPYPDTYWPMVDNGIAVEWLESSGNKCFPFNECDDPQPSPLE